MAWQLLAMNIAGESPLVRQPDNDQFLTLGDRDSVRARVSEFFPKTDWSDPASGHFIAHDQTCSLTFTVLPKEPFLALGIDVRGGPEAILVLVKFAKSDGWQLFDCSGDWLDLDYPSTSGWSGYDRLRRSSQDAPEQA
jgi:hypothetical protein